MKKLSWLFVLLIAVTVINYPNPFNPKGSQICSIECTPDTTTEAFLYIYDMSARKVWQNTFNLTGGIKNTTTWDGYNNYNQLVGNGIYLYWIVDKAKTRLGRGKIWVINQ